jgi:hypothetical protein
MSAATLYCSAARPFDLFAMPEWVAAERAAGRITEPLPIEVEVIHPEREMDGSCRWCGCRVDEVVRFNADGAIAR